MSRGPWRSWNRLELHTRAGVPTVRSVRSRRAPRVVRDHVVPGWLAALGVLLLGLLAISLVGAALNTRPPSRLDDAVLTGPRMLPGRLCVVLASDVSGSMAALAGERQEALRDLTTFSRRVLRSDDVVLVLTYDGAVRVALPPTVVGDLPDGAVPEPQPGTDGTALVPVVDAVPGLLASQRCSATGLASVSDGLLQDEPDRLADALAKAAVTRVHLLVPGGHGRPGPTGSDLLDGIEVHHFDPGDSDELGVAYGRLLAQLTGQQLERR